LRFFIVFSVAVAAVLSVLTVLHQSFAPFFSFVFIICMPQQRILLQIVYLKTVTGAVSASPINAHYFPFTIMRKTANLRKNITTNKHIYIRRQNYGRTQRQQSDSSSAGKRETQRFEIRGGKRAWR
jgi:hypothetical protein